MKLVDQWREWDKNKDSLAEISSLVTSNEWEKLTKIMESLLSYYGLDAENHHTFTSIIMPKIIEIRMCNYFSQQAADRTSKPFMSFSLQCHILYSIIFYAF